MLEHIGERAYEAMSGAGGLADTLREMQEFKPYTVTSATGGQFGMSLGDPVTGQMSFDLATSPEEQAFQQAMFGRAGQFFESAAMPTADREAAIYQRMRDAMTPEEERQRLEQEQRLAAQGRLGVRTAQFGGTPEQLALAKAQEEAKTQAMLDSNDSSKTRADARSTTWTRHVSGWLRSSSAVVECVDTRNDCCRSCASISVGSSCRLR